MKHKLILLLFGLIWSTLAQGQFWVGPKIGGQLITPRYAEEARSDSFTVSSKVNWHAGIALDYSTDFNFEVHTELVYMRVNNRSQSTDAYEVPLISGGLGGQFVDSKTINHFISAPMMARMVFFRRSKVKLMAQLGPRLSYWLSGTGTLRTDELRQFGDEEISYDIKFSNLDSEEIAVSFEEGKHLVSKPNRLQYALDIGFGGVIEFSPTKRAILDIKYSFGHSNMAFNDGNNLSDAVIYTEDLEYRTNMMVVSFAYMFGYDVMLARKGKSTSSVNRKKKK